MKRALIFSLALIAIFPLTGCGKKRRNKNGRDSSFVATGTTGGSGTYTGPILARVADHGDPNGEEQELIELAARARRDPNAEAARLNARYGTALNFSSYPARPAFSPNGFLAQAASAHTNDMATRGFYSHTNPEGVSANGRIRATMYDLAAAFGTNPGVNLTENIGKGTGTAPGNSLKTPQGVHDTFMIDAGVAGAKHRALLLGEGTYARYREIGMSFLHRAPSDYIVQEVAYTNRDRPFVVGVAYDDHDNDGVCRAGEGTPGTPVVLSHASGFTISTATRSAGGFSFEVFVDDTFTLTIGGRSTTVTLQGGTIKVDLRTGQLTR
jgi:uncharacterized protein YkwD